MSFFRWLFHRKVDEPAYQPRMPAPKPREHVFYMFAGNAHEAYVIKRVEPPGYDNLALIEEVGWPGAHWVKAYKLIPYPEAE